MEVILLCLHMLYFIGNLQRWLLRPWQTYFLETRLDLKKKRKKKERKIEISAKTQYTLLLFFGPPNFRKRGILPPKCFNLHILNFLKTSVILPNFIIERILTRHYFGKLNLKHGFSIGFKR